MSDCIVWPETARACTIKCISKMCTDITHLIIQLGEKSVCEKWKIINRYTIRLKTIQLEEKSVREKWKIINRYTIRLKTATIKMTLKSNI